MKPMMKLLLRYHDYINNGKWATPKNNSNCSDPEKLLESIVMKVEDVIENVKFKYWNTEKDSGWNKSYKDWHFFDTQDYGRCFTMQPSEEHAQHGIKVIELKYITYSNIFIHDAGRMYFTGAKQKTKLHKIYDLSFNWEFYDLIDYGGDVCNHDKEYSQYFCTNLAVQEELLRRFGCTSPFGPNKSKICTNEDEGNMIMETIPKLYGTRFYGGCYNPCSYSEITPAEEIGTYTESELILVNLQFKDIIKVTKSYFIYSTLSMIAEIGGYVGLFLGISVNMVINLLEYIIAKIERFQDLKNL